MNNAPTSYLKRYLSMLDGCQKMIDGMNKALDLIAQNNKMTRDEIKVLLYLFQQSERSTTSELTLALSFSPSKTTRVTKTLLKKKAITEKINHSDRRSILISITDEGKKIVEQAERGLNERVTQISSEYNEPELEKLDIALNKLGQVSLYDSQI